MIVFHPEVALARLRFDNLAHRSLHVASALMSVEPRIGAGSRSSEQICFACATYPVPDWLLASLFLKNELTPASEPCLIALEVLHLEQG